MIGVTKCDHSFRTDVGPKHAEWAKCVKCGAMVKDIWPK